MAHWLFEDGIGEQRAMRVEQGQAVAVRIALPDAFGVGAVANVQFVRQIVPGKRGVVRLADGREALLSPIPKGCCEGEHLLVSIIREGVHETGRYKLPLARAATDGAVACDAPDLRARIAADGVPVQVVHPHEADIFAEHGWNEILESATTGVLPFAGGALQIALTPAMTLIDVDGDLAPLPLSLAAARAVARALRLFDLRGSIGVDFPSLAVKAERQAVDAVLAEALASPHERTAMNGFGFVQIVSRLERPSLPALLQRDRAGAAARMLLRRAERVRAPGDLLLTAPASVEAAMRPEWLDILTRRTGRNIGWHIDNNIAPESATTQAKTG